jgi:tRNA (guanine-N7-)-methyltransferase
MRHIRSFVKREARFTAAQSKSLTENWSVYGLEYAAGRMNASELFGQEAPLVIEIGFGMGTSFFETIQHSPDINFIGIEVHRPGVGAFLHQAQKNQLENVRVYCHDAVEVLKHCIADNSIDKVCIFFPDPWPKKRHHKRRLIQAEFVALITQKLKVGGVLHLATDWEDYAQHMLSVLRASSLHNTSASDDFVPRPTSRCVTKYEHRGQGLGHVVRDLVFQK